MPSSLLEWKSSLDSLTPSIPIETLFVNPEESEMEELRQVYGFPTIGLPNVPTVSMVNGVLAERFDDLYSGKAGILRQSDISEEIARRISYWFPDIVVFLILDGLSFHNVTQWDFPKDWRVKYEPCFVNGLSNTESGMPRLIGYPCLAHRLFRLGYKQRLGFSYWERSQNKLADVIFAEFPITQLYRVTTIEEILKRLYELDSNDRTFIQIVRNGMESYCHHHRESPDLIHITNGLKYDIQGIVRSLESSGKKLRLFITSDHGILWFGEQKLSPFIPGTTHARYVEGEAENNARTVVVYENNRIYTLLTGDDVIAKSRSVIEWGFHGGLSAQESLIPLLDIIPNS